MVTVTRSPGRGFSAPAGHGEMHQPLVLGPAGQPVGFLGLAAGLGRDHDLHPAAELTGVFLGGDPVLQGGQALKALLDHGLGELVRQVRGGGAGTLGVLEREGGGEARLLDDVQRGLEVLLGFAGEADDDVRGDGGVRDPFPDLVQDAEELGGAVGPLHVLEDLVRAGLQGHVQLRHDVGGFGHGVDDVVGEGGGVRAGEADPLQPFDFTAGAQELGERLPVAEFDAVGVHVLAQEGHLDGAVVHEGLDLGEDVARAAVLLLAAQGRDDAEGAGVVAAHRDRHPARVHRVPLGGEGGGEDVEGFEDLELRLVVVPGPVQQGGQGTDVVGAEDGVHPRGLLQDGFAVLLRQAAADGDLHPRVGGFDRGQHAEVAVELVVGVLPDGAGVEHHDVGVLTGRPGRSRRLRASRPSARNRARSSGSRKCAPGRCAAAPLRGLHPVLAEGLVPDAGEGMVKLTC